MQMDVDEPVISHSQRFVGRGVLFAAFLLLFGALGEGVSHADHANLNVPAGIIAAT